MTITISKIKRQNRQTTHSCLKLNNIIQTNSRININKNLCDRNTKNVMRKLLVIDSLKINNKKRIKKQQSRKQEKSKKELFLIHSMQMNMQTNIMIIIIFTTLAKTITIFITIHSKHSTLKNEFSTKVQALKTSILFHRNQFRWIKTFFLRIRLSTRIFRSLICSFFSIFREIFRKSVFVIMMFMKLMMNNQVLQNIKSSLKRQLSTISRKIKSIFKKTCYFIRSEQWSKQSMKKNNFRAMHHRSFFCSWILSSSHQ